MLKSCTGVYNRMCVALTLLGGALLIVGALPAVTSVDPICGAGEISEVVCGTGCMRVDAEVAECADGSCSLRDTLPETIQKYVDSGLKTREGLLTEYCYAASNACGEEWYDPNTSKCEDGTIVSVGFYCAESVTCTAEQVCKDDTCTYLAPLCQDKDAVCGGEEYEYYDYLQDSGVVGSDTLRNICGESAEVLCASPTPSPTSMAPYTARMTAPVGLIAFGFIGLFI